MVWGWCRFGGGMGWDAYSTKKTEKQLLVFKKASEKALMNVRRDIKKTKLNAFVDYDLANGGLDCSDSERMLSQALELYNFNNPDEYASCYDENGWSVEKTRLLNEKANWKFKYEKEEAWAYWSARMFLNTCAELGLGIDFSY